VNIVSLITCKATGLSYIGVTKNGRLDDPSNFSPLRYGFGPRFVEAIRRYGTYAFTVQILGHGYPSRKELCLAQRRFIKEHNTLWPNGYNVLKGSNRSVEYDTKYSATAQRMSQNPEWRAAVRAASTERKRSSGWRAALNKRSQNVVWRHNISAARPTYLLTRWHVKSGLVPPDTPAENCGLCKAAAQRKEHSKLVKITTVSPNIPTENFDLGKGVVQLKERLERMKIATERPTVKKWVLAEPIEIPPRRSLEEELDEQVRRINEMFKRK
jgi:hypothetical protein